MTLETTLPLTLSLDKFTVTELQAQTEYVEASKKGWKFAAHGQHWFYNFMDGKGAAVVWPSREILSFPIEANLPEWTSACIKELNKNSSKLQKH